jgi:hypothetical protein
MGDIGEDCGIPHAALLVAFAEAVIGDDDIGLNDARQRLAATLGDAALVDSAAVIATFNGLDRVADATGIQIEQAKAVETAEIRAALGIDDFPSMRNR